MAITFIQQKRKQQYLILCATIVILVTLIVIWRGFLAEPKPKPIAEVRVFIPKELKINFEVLNSQILKELQPFEEITPLEGAAGRENPFIPYSE